MYEPGDHSCEEELKKQVRELEAQVKELEEDIRRIRWRIDEALGIAVAPDGSATPFAAIAALLRGAKDLLPLPPSGYTGSHRIAELEARVKELKQWREEDAETIANFARAEVEKDDHIAVLEQELAEARDEIADYDNAILRKFDKRAAESTDLYTYISIIKKRKEAAEEKVRELEAELAEARRLIKESLPAVDYAEQDPDNCGSYGGLTDRLRAAIKGEE
jgi:chromosome segregation ATPase